MSINYRYEIAVVNEVANCMEILYTAPGHPTQLIGARLPYEGESLEGVIRAYAPIVYWENLQRRIVAPTVGESGEINAAQEALAMATTRSQILDSVVQPISSGTQIL